MSSDDDGPPQRATSQGVSLAFRILRAAFPTAKSALRGPTLDHVAGVFFWGAISKIPLLLYDCIFWRCSNERSSITSEILLLCGNIIDFTVWTKSFSKLAFEYLLREGVAWEDQRQLLAFTGYQTVSVRNSAAFIQCSANYCEVLIIFQA